MFYVLFYIDVKFVLVARQLFHKASWFKRNVFPLCIMLYSGAQTTNRHITHEYLCVCVQVSEAKT